MSSCIFQNLTALLLVLQFILEALDLCFEYARVQGVAVLKIKSYLAAIVVALLVFGVIVFLALPDRTGRPAGNELRYGFTTEPVTFDPLNLANTADGRSILFNVFEGLVRPDSQGNLVPAVAQSYSIDGLVYTFTLREGLRFHDGSYVQPEDVVFSLNVARNAGFVGLNRIADVQVYGEREVRVTLGEADPEFLPYLTIGIVPQANTDRENNPIGTGPFRIERYAPQQYLRLARNPYYRIPGVPALDYVTIVFVPGSDALVTGVLGGHLDGAGVTGAMVGQFNPNHFDIIPWFSSTVQLFVLNNARPPLDDVRVRLAINYAVDVQGIIDIAFHGHGQPSGSPIIPGMVRYFDETLRDPFPRDLSRAASLLAEAGFPAGFPLEITVPSNFTMHVATAQVLVNQLAEAGITATIRLVDWATWLAEVHRDRNYAASIISIDGSTVSPRSFLARYLTGAGGNFMNFSNSEFDAVFTAALVEPDEEQRIALYKEAQRIISQNAASVFIQDILGFRVFPAGRFGGVTNYPLHIMNFASMYSR
jgi:peptide/nickel transport system substrate-binding protein